jgi:hypothetical protein
VVLLSMDEVDDEVCEHKVETITHLDRLEPEELV